MSNSNTVIYRDLDISPALTESIEKKIAKLNRFSNNIFSSRVVLDTPRQHSMPNHHKGKVFSAHLDLDVNGHPIVVHKDSASIHLAVKEAFKAAETKLKAMNSKTKDKRHRALEANTLEASNDEEMDDQFEV